MAIRSASGGLRKNASRRSSSSAAISRRRISATDSWLARLDRYFVRMTEAETTASLTHHVRPIEAGAHVIAAAFLDGAPTLALADGVVVFGEPGEHRRVVVHPDATILTAVGD